MKSCSSCFIRPRPVAWFFFLLCFGTCVALGSWQVKRLHWKESIIAELADANAHSPLTQLPKDAAELSDLQFRKVQLKGTWLGGIEFHVTPRYYRNQFGYAIFTPLKLNDGRIVIVNRGWVPGAKKEAGTRPDTQVHGYTTLIGLIRTDRDRSYFTPPNQPSKNLWFGRDTADMAADAGLKNVVPITVDLVDVNAPSSMPTTLTPATALNNSDTVPQKLPIPSDGTIRLRNDHLSYIITWYGIALGILVIFAVYHRKKA